MRAAAFACRTIAAAASTGARKRSRFDTKYRPGIRPSLSSSRCDYQLTAVLPCRSKMFECSAEITALIGLVSRLQCVSFCGIFCGLPGPGITAPACQ